MRKGANPQTRRPVLEDTQIEAAFFFMRAPLSVLLLGQSITFESERSFNLLPSSQMYLRIEKAVETRYLFSNFGNCTFCFHFVYQKEKYYGKQGKQFEHEI